MVNYGTMAIVEMEFDPSKRDFLTLGFARRRRDGGQPPRRPRQPDSPLGQQPPEWKWFDKKVSRRTVVGVGSLLVGLGVGAFVVDRLGLLKFFPPLPDQPEPETLESLVAKAKKMEDEYSINDLSDKRTRDNYTKLLADIFIRYT